MIERFTNKQVFLTSTCGIGGILKSIPEDFIVNEVSEFKYSNFGKYLILEITKKNWDLYHCIKYISKILNISYKRIGFAGTKDKRAITTQKISIYNIKKENIEKLNIKDISFRFLGYSNVPIKIGDLIKNNFSIIIRNLKYDLEFTRELLKKITEEINSNGGVPNYYGPQRFGEQREITHLIGRLLVHRNFKDAVMTYLTYCSCNEEDASKKMRMYILKTEDFKGGLKLCPDYLGHEKTILNSLIKYPSNFLHSILSLPKNLCMMFIHSFQS